ncbi:hypothetical protein CYMTET_43840 [Cymbomonas tetramitiformis]|uniref:Uncharacterized protein n=1 Tax=Cymbomonas tetramitiformis TaxID=36881 RepID=A0AAE0C3F7_9CHLO|nr:hypothetical protein CYMTET_43840 [Cymbomonas tetramitiformis]
MKYTLSTSKWRATTIRYGYTRSFLLPIHFGLILQATVFSSLTNSARAGLALVAVNSSSPPAPSIQGLRLVEKTYGRRLPKTRIPDKETQARKSSTITGGDTAPSTSSATSLPDTADPSLDNAKMSKGGVSREFTVPARCATSVSGTKVHPSTKEVDDPKRTVSLTDRREPVSAQTVSQISLALGNLPNCVFATSMCVTSQSASSTGDNW